MVLELQWTINRFRNVKSKGRYGIFMKPFHYLRLPYANEVDAVVSSKDAFEVFLFWQENSPIDERT